MFADLVKLGDSQVEVAADTLNRGDPMAIRVDPQPVYVVFLPTTAQGKPYEVDFLAVQGDMKTPAAMDRKGRRILAKWAQDAVGRICRRWRERHPES